MIGIYLNNCKLVLWGERERDKLTQLKATGEVCKLK